MCPRPLNHVWNSLGLFLDSAWILFRISMNFSPGGLIRICLKFAMELSWVLLGCSLEFRGMLLWSAAWNLIGFCMDSLWNLHGIVLWSADWTLLGISSERPLALAFSGFWQKMVRNPNACLTHPTCLPLNHGWTSLGLFLGSAWFLFGISMEFSFEVLLRICLEFPVELSWVLLGCSLEFPGMFLWSAAWNLLGI